MSKSYKTVKCKGTIGGVIEDACSMLEELGSECDDAANNFPNSSHPKAEAFAEAASTLQDAQTPEIPEWLIEKAMDYSESVPTRKGRAAGRAVRCGNACGMLTAAAEAIRNLLGDEKDSDKADEGEQLASEIEEIASNCENVEFPGLYG